MNCRLRRAGLVLSFVGLLLINLACSDNKILLDRIARLEQRVRELESGLASNREAGTGPSTPLPQGFIASPPDPGNSGIKNGAQKQELQTTEGRCQAITKKGTQCRRIAKARSSMCWQHK